ncbi:hypothetical protein BC830DRAFT_1119570 [Chytriomyces sp. MP71]|nr:hypothetical protein BC830DRAFT_1119570 [Chytriomyces sp. MP71]
MAWNGRLGESTVTAASGGWRTTSESRTNPAGSRGQLGPPGSRIGPSGEDDDEAALVPPPPFETAVTLLPTAPFVLPPNAPVLLAHSLSQGTSGVPVPHPTLATSIAPLVSHSQSALQLEPQLQIPLQNNTNKINSEKASNLSSLRVSVEVCPNTSDYLPQSTPIPSLFSSYSSHGSQFKLPPPSLVDNSSPAVSHDDHVVASLTGSMHSPYASRPPSPLSIPLVDPLVHSTIQHLLSVGTRMVKYPNKAQRRPEERIIRLIHHDSCVAVGWESKKKKESLSMANFHSIREIRLGQNTKAFELHGKLPDIEERAFSIIYVAADGRYKMLNLVARSKEECAIWVSGLHMLLANMSALIGATAATTPLANTTIPQSMNSWLERIWSDVDANNSGLLGLESVTQLMGRLNIRLSKLEVKSALKNSGIPSRGLLKFEDFERLYRTLRFRPEIGELFSSLAKTNPSGLTFSEFENFTIHIQKTNITQTRCLEIYKKYLPPGPADSCLTQSATFNKILHDPSDMPLMDMDHFSAFLLSANNAIFRKQNTAFVYQDMTRPLTDYLINSSHNTYLLGDQFAGESSVEGYIRALQRGCRCLELDCFDGHNGPVIYHKNSLTNRILFKDVIEVIHRYAFVASTYPVILSLEMHCSYDQQAALAKLLIDVFGDSLLKTPNSDAALGRKGKLALPSPAELMGKILVKGKIRPMHPDLERTMSIDDLEYESEEDSSLGSGFSSALALSPSACVYPGSVMTPGSGAKILGVSHLVLDPEEVTGGVVCNSEVVAEIDDANGRHCRIGPSHVFGQHATGADENASANTRQTTPSTRLVAASTVGAAAVNGVKERKVSLRSQGSLGSIVGAGNGAHVGGIDDKTAIKKRYIFEKSLMDLVVYCKAVRFTGMEMLDTMKYDEMVSITESKFLFLLAKFPTSSFLAQSISAATQPATAAAQSKSPTQSPTATRKGATFTSPATASAGNTPPISSPRGTQLLPNSRLAAHHWNHHHTFHLTRIYPSPLRIGSSNTENPCLFWDCGVQMVALNYQKYDRGLQVNGAMFKGNGGCGYVLKAGLRDWRWRWVQNDAGGRWCWRFLLDQGKQYCGGDDVGDGDGGGRDRSYTNPTTCGDRVELQRKSFMIPATVANTAMERSMVLTVKVISGQQLPSAKEGGASPVVRLITSPPYVEIEIIGVEADCMKHKTRSSSTGGFNAMWKETFQFRITCPELAVLRFQVFSHENRLTHEVIGSYAIALDNMELGNVGVLKRRDWLHSHIVGYRHVPLLNRKGEVVPFSTLFLLLSLD